MVGMAFAPFLRIIRSILSPRHVLSHSLRKLCQNALLDHEAINPSFDLRIILKDHSRRWTMTKILNTDPELLSLSIFE
jgi:hypothetical protein